MDRIFIFSLTLLVAGCVGKNDRVTDNIPGIDSAGKIQMSAGNGNDMPGSGGNSVQEEPLPGYFNDPGTIGVGLCLIEKNDFEIWPDTTFRSAVTVLMNAPHNSGVIPVFFKPDYGIFYLLVLKNHGKYLAIKKNKNETAYILSAAVKEVVSWKELLMKKAVSIENRDWKQNPSLSLPGSKGRSIDFKRDSQCSVVQLQDDWIQVKNEQGQTCWIRWKEADKLKIWINLLM